MRVERLAAEIISDSDHFAELVVVMLAAEERKSQWAAWVFSHCLDRDPDLIYPHLTRLVQELDQPKHHDGVRRSILRALEPAKLPEELWGELADKCFRYLADPQAAAAIRVFAMSVLDNICREVPELRAELKLIIEDQWDHATAAFRARARRVLRG